MKRTLTLFAAAALAGAVGLAGSALAQTNTSQANRANESVDLKGLSCERLLEINAKVLPRVVYWLDGYTQGGQRTSTVQTNWMVAPVADVVTECRNNPTQMASEVVRGQRERYAQ